MRAEDTIVSLIFLSSMKFIRALLLLSLILLSTGCLKANVLSPEEQETIVDTQNLRALWTANATLRPGEGKIGNGFAEAQYQTDGHLFFAIRITLFPEEEGDHYEAWLISSEPPDVIDLGTLESPKNDGTYFLTFRGSPPPEQKDFLQYKTVVVTREPGSEHIAEGTLTVVEDSG